MVPIINKLYSISISKLFSATLLHLENTSSWAFQRRPHFLHCNWCILFDLHRPQTGSEIVHDANQSQCPIPPPPSVLLKSIVRKQPPSPYTPVFQMPHAAQSEFPSLPFVQTIVCRAAVERVIESRAHTLNKQSRRKKCRLVRTFSLSLSLSSKKKKKATNGKEENS